MESSQRELRVHGISHWVPVSHTSPALVEACEAILDFGVLKLAEPVKFKKV